MDPAVASPLLLLQMEESQEHQRQKKLQEATSMSRSRVTIHDHFRQMTMHNMLCALRPKPTPHPQVQESEDSLREETHEQLQLWLLIVNDRHDAPGPETMQELEETACGKWVRGGPDNEEAALPSAIQSLLFEALETLFVQKCLKGEFVLEEQQQQHNKSSLLVLKQPQFVYRRPSLSRLNQFERYLEEQLESPAFKCRFQLLLPRHMLTVAIQMTHFVDSKSTYDDNLWTARMRRGWEVMMGLPHPQDHSMVDVWHADATLVARILCETKSSDVGARFLPTISDKRRKRRKQLSGELEDDKSTTATSGADEKRDEDEQPEDDDEDDEEEDEEEEPNTSASSLGGVAATRKKSGRKKRSATKFELEESTVPTSPDITVNTRQSSGPTVHLCFMVEPAAGGAGASNAAPEEGNWQLRTSRHVHIFKRKRRKMPDGCTFPINDLNAPIGLADMSGDMPSLNLTSVSTSSIAESVEQTPAATSGSLHASLAAAVIELSSSVNGAPVSGGGNLATPVRGSIKSTGKSNAVLTTSAKSAEKPAPELPTISPSGVPLAGSQPIKRPVHPLLEALKEEVRQATEIHNETKNLLLPLHFDEKVPNALEYEARGAIPPLASKCQTMLANATKWFLSEPKFKPWQVEYSSARNKNATPNKHQILLGFDPQKLERFSASHIKSSLRANSLQVRDAELEIGLRWLAMEALTSWQQPWNSWQASNGQLQGKPTSERDRSRFAARVLPYVRILHEFFSRKHTNKGKSPSPNWLSLDEFCQASMALANDVDGDVDMEVDRSSRTCMQTKQLTRPELALATVDKVKCLGTMALSEWMLRGFHPVASAKPFEYVVVCPHSPSEWLATLAESYLCNLKSLYHQSHLGAQHPVGLSKLPSNPQVSVDTTNSFLLVDCATSRSDAFETYRRAGEMLQSSLLAPDHVANAKVVYLVAPFRRHDVKHRVWMMGAFARGLFGLGVADSKRPSVEQFPVDLDRVVLEVLFLDDLCEVSVDCSPFQLLPSCLALYNRVAEKVTLTPIERSVDSKTQSQPLAATTRYVRERAFNLAPENTEVDANERKAPRPSMEPGEEVLEAVPIRAHGAYALSADNKWLFSAFTDPSGSVMETHALNLATDFPAVQEAARLRWGLTFVWEKLLAFLALFGERGAVVWCKKGELTEDESALWKDLNAKSMGLIEPTDDDHGIQLGRYAELLQLSALVQMVAHEAIQLRYNEDGLQRKPVRDGNQHLTETYAVLPKRESEDLDTKTLCGFLAVTPYESAGQSRLLSMARANVQHTTVPKRDEVVFQVTWKACSSARQGANADEAELLHRVVHDYASLSWLTLHPMTLERQSPWPLHLTAIDKMQREYNELQTQLRADPLE